MYRVAFLTAFFGAFQSLVPQWTPLAMPCTLRTCSDPTAAFKVRIQSSKTDQAGTEQHITINRAPNPPCSSFALQDYLATWVHGHTILLNHRDGSLLTRFQFTSIFGSTSRTHSFHTGTTSTAAAVGLSLADLCFIGRWRSEAFRGYIRPFSAHTHTPLSRPGRRWVLVGGREDLCYPNMPPLPHSCRASAMEDMDWQGCQPGLLGPPSHSRLGRNLAGIQPPATDLAAGAVRHTMGSTDAIPVQGSEDLSPT